MKQKYAVVILLALICAAIRIETCGVVGALAYTFSDTFWFSAVEAEVYAFSSFLTALMFWLIICSVCCACPPCRLWSISVRKSGLLVQVC